MGCPEGTVFSQALDFFVCVGPSSPVFGFLSLALASSPGIPSPEIPNCLMSRIGVSGLRHIAMDRVTSIGPINCGNCDMLSMTVGQNRRFAGNHVPLNRSRINLRPPCLHRHTW